MADSGKGSPKKEKKRPSAVEETLLLKLVQYYFKVAGGVLFVWLFGYFEFSPSWLLIALVIFVWRVKYSKVKENQIATAQHLARDEQGAILARMDDLPSWVSGITPSLGVVPMFRVLEDASMLAARVTLFSIDGFMAFISLYHLYYYSDLQVAVIRCIHDICDSDVKKVI